MSSRGIEWIERVIPGHRALALVAYVGGRSFAVIDQCYDEGRPVHAVFMVTNTRQPACIAESRDDAMMFVERSIHVARVA